MTRIAPSLIQEFGGDRAGSMQNTWTGTILGKAKNKISTEAWMALGLLDPKQVVYNKVGPVGWKPGAIKGTDQALQDPLKWSESVLIPALKDHGFNTGDQLSLAKALMPLFRDRNANRLANVLVADKDRARLHKDEGLINKVPSAEKAYQQTLRNDPGAAWGAVRSQMANLSSVLFGGGMGESPVAIALTNIALGVNTVARALERHPLLANGIGGALGLSAGIATLKVFGVALRWIFAPLKLLFAPLRMLGTAFMDAFGPGIARGLIAGGRFILTGLGRLGPLILRGIALLAPMVMEGVGAAFALLSNPVGWTIMAVVAVAAVAALAYHFRGALGRAWGQIKAVFTGLDWKGIGMTIAMSIADALTFGLASKLPAIASVLRNHLPTWAGGTPATLAGKRAMGGPVLGGRAYLVGERGPEIFHAPMSGSILTASHTARLLREAHGSRRSVLPAMPRDRRGSGAGGNITYSPKFYIQGANDPDAVARAVDRKFRRMANGQAHLLSD